MAERDNDLIGLRPEEQGYLVAALGGDRTDNPYPDKTCEHAAWLWGWEERQKDH